VIEVILARTKFARTPVTMQASPAVAVEGPIVAYWPSASTIAVCSAMLTAEGAVPKSVCRRFAVEAERDVALENRIGRNLRVVVWHGDSDDRCLVSVEVSIPNLALV
jgi:hypothetical protein